MENPTKLSPSRAIDHRTVQSLVLRMVGDSGDGIQVIGTLFTETSASMGNDLCTFPDYPAEIRAPMGTVAGVSGFQVMIASRRVYTFGDQADILLAMNPAALKSGLPELKKDGIILCDESAFSEKNLAKASYGSNPLTDGSISEAQVISVPITDLTLKELSDLGLRTKEATRCKNFFALGLLYWLCGRALKHTEGWIESKFASKPEIKEANLRALHAGFHFAEQSDQFPVQFEIKAAPLKPGKYRYVTGNEATALGLMTAAEISGLKLYLGSYPITPASEILHFLSHQASLGVHVFQAEDEIAGVCSAIGASYAGALAVTTTSGPGLSLKSEGLGLAVMLECPLIAIDVQRGGPSTGLPTKTEQADLLQAMFGRSGESPMPVIAPVSSADCFETAILAARIAVGYMTPVLMLSDGYLANGAAPWHLPDLSKIEPIPVHFETDPEKFAPYKRNEHLARPWAIPGTPHLEHRLGGLEKRDIDGAVCHDPLNHAKMCALRAAKIEKIQEIIPKTKIFGSEGGGKLLVLGWGSSFGAIRAAVTELREEGVDVSHVHLRFLNPFPKDLPEILSRFEAILVPELNLGQLALLVQGKLGQKVRSYTKMQGRPFKESEIIAAIRKEMETF